MKRVAATWGLAAVGIGLLSFLGAAWLNTWPILGDWVSFGRLWLIAAIVLVLVVLAIALAVKFRPTWYRRLAITIVGSILGAEPLRWVAAAYVALDSEPPTWLRDWFGEPSGATALGAFLCATVLAVLDFLTKHGDRIRISLTHPPRDPVHAPPVVEVVEHRSSPKERTARSHYLRLLEQDVENRLRSSIHNALMLELAVEDTPTATHLPWRYRDTSTSRQFGTINEAVAVYHDRVLLLGSPGSGKSMTLLHIAQRLIKIALSDETAPIPLLANLSKLVLKAENGGRHTSFHIRQPSTDDKQDRRVRDWLVDQLSQYPGIPRDIAGIWIDNNQVAALLDGLDEVDDHRRAELVTLLNETYLYEHPTAPVFVCSRINEYLPLQSSKHTRLQLEGSITLQPLSTEQIGDYLRKAGAEAIINALPGDKVLQEMASNPLTLSMMTLAYGTSVPTGEGQSATERRHTLMEAYVRRMLQRKERRDRDMPFDENPDNAVPESSYTFSPTRVNRTLGWLAVRMSVRMQTALPPNRLYTFLCLDAERDQRSEVWWATALARASVVTVAGLVAAASITPASTATYLEAVALCAACGLLTLTAPLLGHSLHHSGRLRANSLFVVAAVLFLCIFILLLGAPSLAFADAVGWETAPTAAGTVVLCLLAGSFGLMFRLLLEEDDFLPFPITTGVALAISVAIHLVSADSTSPNLTGGIFATSLVVAAAWTTFSDGDLKDAILVGGFALSMLAALAFATWLLDPLGWVEALLTLLALLGIFASGEIEHPQLISTIATLSFVGGSVLGGPSEALVATTLVVTSTMLIWMASADERFKIDPVPTVERWARSVGDRYLFGPVLRTSLGLTRQLPRSLGQFLAYSESALLLKRSANDVEFVHRTLRDYFALRDLQPLLADRDPARRHEAIRSLGFQGDAAIDALAEFAAAPDPSTRAAAVWAFGRIASPTVKPYLEAALADPAATVRSTAIGSVENRQLSETVGLLTPMADDPDLGVRQSFLDAALRLSTSHRYRDLLDGPGLVRLREDPELRSYLVNLVRTNRTPEIGRVIELLVSLDEQQAIPAFAEVLPRLTNVSHKQAALVGIFRLGGTDALPTVLQLAERESPEVRMAAAKAFSMPSINGGDHVVLALNAMGTRRRWGPFPLR